MSGSKEIIPGKGIGGILLGMTMKDVEKIVGKPDETEKLDYDDGEHSVNWYYYEMGMDLTFESDDDERLSFISLEGEDYQLYGKIKIGDSLEKVLADLKKLNKEEPEIEEMESDDDSLQQLVGLDEDNINLWFTDGVLDEIQFGPKWEDDETPIWPSVN